MKFKIINLMIVVFILNIFMVYADCVNPKNSLIIDEDITFCKGTFELDSGMVVNSDNIDIVCDETIIKGFDNGALFSIENKENILIKNCVIDNFQIGFDITSSKNLVIENNEIINNQIGILLNDVYVSNFSSNTFENNLNSAIFMDLNEILNIAGNIFNNNIFFDTAFNLVSYEDMPHNSYFDNIYNDNLIGPNDYVTDYIYESEDLISYRDDEADENETTTDEVSDEVDENIFTGVEVFEVLDNQNFVDDSGEIVNSENIVKKAYEMRGFSDDEILDAVNRVSKIEEIVDIDKNIIFDYDNEVIIVNIKINSSEKLEDVEFFEYIPKSFANHFLDINFNDSIRLEVIDEDPLIVWNYNSVSEDEEVELSYSVDKSKVDMTALAVASNINEESPVTVSLANCVSCDPKSSRYMLFVPLLLIPLIVVIFVFVGRNKN
ncbi:MAG: right-handed parallel beta-helix repeat-containing protein [Candidatus Woesearchaeota archaeon]